MKSIADWRLRIADWSFRSRVNRVFNPGAVAPIHNPQSAIHNRITLFLCIVATLLATSCTLRERQDPVTPQQEFRAQRAHIQREPIILIPGTLGSRLFNSRTGEIAWGSFASTLS